jgi:dihydrofolate synthase/folylpolyglutamate synthase
VPRGGTLVAGPLSKEALAVAERTAVDRAAVLRRAGRDFVVEPEAGTTFGVRSPRGVYERLALRALGGFQRANFALAVCAAEEYLGALDPAALREAAASVSLPGRFELTERDPMLIFDGAHNPDAVRALKESLGEVVGERRLVAVLSVLEDKDAAGMLSRLLPLCARVVFTRSSNPRALPPATLESLCRQLGGPPADVVADPLVAVERARTIAGPDGAVLVTGSIYLLSDLVRRGASASRAQSV